MMQLVSHGQRGVQEHAVEYLRNPPPNQSSALRRHYTKDSASDTDIVTIARKDFPGTELRLRLFVVTFPEDDDEW